MTNYEDKKADVWSLLKFMRYECLSFSNACIAERDDRILLVRELLFDAYDVMSGVGRAEVNKLLEERRDTSKAEYREF